MKKKILKTIGKTIALLFIAIAIISTSCTKKEEVKNYMICGKKVAEEQLLKTMSDLYSQQNKVKFVFDTCEVIHQDNGYTIVVAKAQNGDEHIHFAVLVDGQVNGGEKSGEEPQVTCTCTSNCNTGCVPKYSDKLGWICTECEYTQGGVIPSCVKTVSASMPLPGPGNQ